jgi:hypothetical protein
MDGASTGVVLVVCEGQLLEGLSHDCLRYDQCFTAAQEVVLEQTTGALAEGLFYINDIIASLQKPKKQYKSFVMNYNTQLCNTAWGKKLLARVAKRTCFF